MEKVNLKTKAAQLQHIQTTPVRDPIFLKPFLLKFSKCEYKEFLKNISHHFSHIITRHIRKMKEANQRLKESFQKK